MTANRFRAIINDNTTIVFDFESLFDDLFSRRVLLIPWLKDGNEPDRSTGLLDKNGKEIFEGDIISIPDYPAHAEVIWWNGGFLAKGGWLSGDDLCFYNEQSTVIGNIHENPELLEAT
jgi:hypothetical protein